MAKKVKEITPKKEVEINPKEIRGEIKMNFKKFYFPEINKTIEAENIAEATKIANK